MKNRIGLFVTMGVFLLSAFFALYLSSIKIATGPHPTSKKNSVPVNEIALALYEGTRADVIFDACPFEDEGWLDIGDPLGLLKCNETYSVRYVSETGRWNGVGLEERATHKYGERKLKDYTGAGSDPRLGRLTIWGANFGVKASGEITYKTDEVVGHIVLENQPE